MVYFLNTFDELDKNQLNIKDIIVVADKNKCLPSVEVYCLIEKKLNSIYTFKESINTFTELNNFISSKYDSNLISKININGKWFTLDIVDCNNDFFEGEFNDINITEDCKKYKSTDNSISIKYIKTINLGTCNLCIESYIGINHLKLKLNKSLVCYLTDDSHSKYIPIKCSLNDLLMLLNEINNNDSELIRTLKFHHLKPVDIIRDENLKEDLLKLFDKKDRQNVLKYFQPIYEKGNLKAYIKSYFSAFIPTICVLENNEIVDSRKSEEIELFTLKALSIRDFIFSNSVKRIEINIYTGEIINNDYETIYRDNDLIVIKNKNNSNNRSSSNIVQSEIMFVKVEDIYVKFSRRKSLLIQKKYKDIIDRYYVFKKLL